MEQPRECFHLYEEHAEWRRPSWIDQEAVKPLGPHHVAEPEAIQATEGPRAGPKSAVRSSPIDPLFRDAAVKVATAADGDGIAIRKLPPEETTGTLVAETDEVKAIILTTLERMWKYLVYANVQVECYLTLINVLKEEAARQDDIIELGAVAKICLGLSAHMGVEEVVATACELLWCLGTSSSFKAKEDDASGQQAIEEISVAMLVHLHSAEVQKMACGAIWSLVNKCSSNKAVARRANAASRISSGMEVHNLNIEVQKMGCSALACLCGDKTVPRGDSPEEAAGDSSAVVAVVAALKRFADDATLQAKACAAVCSLAASGTAAQEALYQAGAVNYIAAAMEAHEFDASVQQQACAALRILACHPANQACIANVPFDVTLVEEAFHTEDKNRDITLDPREMLLGMSRNTIFKNILGLNNPHEYNEVFQKIDTDGSASIELDEFLTAFMPPGGLVDLICATLASHKEVPGVQSEGFGVLRNLCQVQEPAAICARIGVAGGVARICKGMEANAQDPDVQEQGCGALWSLACHIVNRGRAASHGGIKLVCQAMQDHASHKGVQEQGCGALHNLSCKAGNPDRIKEARGIEVLQQAIRNFPDNEIIQLQGKRAVERILI